MSRLAPLALALVFLLAFEPLALARRAPTGRGTVSGMDRREFNRVVKALDDDADLIDDSLASDDRFRALAEDFGPASRSRLAGGKAMVALGVIFMALGALIGAPMYVVAPDRKVAAIGTMAGAIGGGFLLFVPGVAVMATPSGAERAMRTYWQENRASFLRPEASTGPRLRLAAGWSPPRTASLPVFTLSF